MTDWYRVSAKWSYGLEQKTLMRKAVNLAIVGKENCNELDEGNSIVSSYPASFDAALQSAHWNLSAVHGTSLYLKLDPSTGETEASLEEPYEYYDENGRLRRRKKKND